MVGGIYQSHHLLQRLKIGHDLGGDAKKVLVDWGCCEGGTGV